MQLQLNRLTSFKLKDKTNSNMKKIIEIILKVICSALITIMALTEILCALIMWDKSFADAKSTKVMHKLWNNE